ncbi:MAG: glycosyltransferase family 4 protein [Acidimicrobiales bacterium]|nr:glycosyltransferase family 4 protein [Acidimicrobiales bacterium]
MADRPPRLLLVPAFLGGHGGLENHVLSHARVAARAGYEVTVVTPRPIPADGELGPLLREWAEVDDAERHWRATPAGRVARAGAGAKELATRRRPLDARRRATLALDRARPYLDGYWQGDGSTTVHRADLVHTFGKPKPFVTGAIRAAADAGVPVVYTEIAQVTEAYAARPDLVGFRAVADRCDHVAVMAEHQGDDVRARFGYEGPVTIVEQWADGVEEELLAIDRLPAAPQAGVVRIGSLCRLSGEKGLDTLLAAFARIAPDRPGARLIVAGTGACEADLRHLARRSGITERVEFLGFVPDRAAFYRDVDVFAVCSIEEGGPITGAEAMAAALPIVTTPCGAMPDRVRDGVEGLRIAVGNVDATAAALDRLVGDPALRHDLGAAARARYLERNTRAANEQRLLDLWQGLRDDARRAPARATATP